jgi:hypothetical protein
MVELTQQVESQKREIQQLKRELATYQHADGTTAEQPTDRRVQIDHVPGPPPAEPGQPLGGKVRTSPEEEAGAARAQ